MHGRFWRAGAGAAGGRASPGRVGRTDGTDTLVPASRPPTGGPHGARRRLGRAGRMAPRWIHLLRDTGRRPPCILMPVTARFARGGTPTPTPADHRVPPVWRARASRPAKPKCWSCSLKLARPAASPRRSTCHPRRSNATSPTWRPSSISRARRASSVRTRSVHELTDLTARREVGADADRNGGRPDAQVPCGAR